MAPLRVGPDTVAFGPDPLHSRVFHATARIDTTGWVAVQDSLAVYVGRNVPGAAPGGLAAVGQRRQTAAWVGLHRQYDIGRTGAARQTQPKTLPNWGWLVLIGLLLTALWLEPKLA